MPELEKIGSLPLNMKKLISVNLVWNKIQKLQSGSLIFITGLILLLILGESLPKCNSTSMKSILGTVFTTRVGVIALSKSFFMQLSTKLHG